MELMIIEIIVRTGMNPYSFSISEEIFFTTGSSFTMVISCLHRMA